MVIPKFPREVTLTELAALCDLTPARIRQLVELRVIPQTKRGRYQLRPALHGYVRWLRGKAEGRPKREGTEAGAQARERRELAEARLKEIEVGEKEGTLLPADLLDQQFGAACDALRAALLVLPSKWAPALVGCKTIQEAMLRLEPAVREAMEALVAMADELEADELEADDVGDEVEVVEADDDAAGSTGAPRPASSSA